MRGKKSISEVPLKKFFFVLFVILELGIVLALTGHAVEQIYPSNVTVTPFNVLRNTYNGATTNFTGFNKSKYENFSSITLEKTSYGKISFLQPLDLVKMADSNNTVNFDKYINISNNLIYVNNNYLPGINKTVDLSFYGINFTNPQIYHDGALCTSCNFISYSSGIYKFNTTSFSGSYWLKEKVTSPVCGNGICEAGETATNCPSDCATSSGSGGGGAGGGSVLPSNNSIPTTGTKQYDFNITPSLIRLKMNKGTYYQEIIKVMNNGTSPLTISLSISGLQKFVFPQISSFSLQPNETKYVRFDIFVSNDQPADVYVGKIVFTSSHVKKEADVILQVNPKQVLFDIRTTVLKKYIPPRGIVRANVTIINMGDLRNFDVHVLYKAIDFNKKVYTLKNEQFAINRSRSKVLFLSLPDNMSMGTYIFYTQVSAQNVSASSYDTFVIEDVSTASWFLIIFIILLLMYIAYRFYKSKRKSFALRNLKKGKQEKEIPKPKDLPVEVPKLP